MTDQPDKPASTPSAPAEVTLDAVTYQISPTAFRSHFQVVTSDGRLVGLIERIDVGGEAKFMARPASGAGMTQSLMIKIAEAAFAAGIIT